MITTTDETGVWNNYASEAPIYFATFPSEEQQRRYWLQGGLSVILFSVLLTVAAIAS